MRRAEVKRPLGDLRTPVLCHHRQLHRPADAGDTEADTRKRSALERSRLRLDRVRVPVRLCADNAAGWARHRPARHSTRLCIGSSRVEHGGDVALAGADLGTIRCGAFRPRPGRGGQFPGRDQDSGRMVSRKRTRARDRPVQQRLERWGGGGAIVRSHRGLPIGLEGGFRRYRLSRPDLAGSVARVLSKTGRRLRRFKRNGRRAVGAAAHDALRLGFHRRQIRDRPGVVVLPLLDSSVPADHVPAAIDEPWSSSGLHLHRGGRGVDFAAVGFPRR